MSLLSIVNAAQDRLSLPRSTSIVTGDNDARHFLGLAQQEGKELARAGSWQALMSEKTFTTVAAAAQTSSIPTDFDRIINDTMFNRTSKRWVEGPLDAVTWQHIQATLTTRVNPAFRIRGGTILISPTPTAGDTVAYEYITKNWCTDSTGATSRTAWVADGDLAVLDEELHTLGLIWRYKQSKGFDYAEAFSTYQLQVTQALVRDGGKPRITTDGYPRAFGPTPLQIPETLVGLS